MGNAFSEDPINDEEIQAQAEQYLVDLLREDGHRMVTSSIDINLTQKDAGWRIETDEEFQDAILGGLLAAFDGFEDSE